MAAKFFVFAGGRWRELSLGSGRVCGWAGHAKFLVARGGRLQRAKRRRVLRGLRALAAGCPRSVRDSAPLAQRRHYSPKYSPKQERHTPRHHCCCDAHKRALDDVKPVPPARPSAVSVTTQTVATVDPSHEKQPPPPTKPKPGPLSRKRLLSTEKPLEKSKSKLQEASPKTTEAVQTDTESQHCKELIINEDDVDALRNFLDKNNVFDVDLESFDADDDYKSMVFYKINPLVTVERCAQIGRLYKRRNSNDISLADFATKLGLRAVTDVAEKKRYKMRKRDTAVVSTESDKENHSDSSVMVVSDRSAEKDVMLKTKSEKTGILRKQPLSKSSKNILNKRPLQRDKESKKNTPYKRPLQGQQSSSNSESEQTSSSVSSQADDSDNELTASEETSDSAFESRSDRKARLKRSRKRSESYLRRSGRLSALGSPNRKAKESEKKPEANESKNKVDLPVDRDGIKQPTKKSNVSELPKQKANDTERPLRRKTELEMLQEQNEARRLKKYKLNETKNRKVNESASQSSSKKNESALDRDELESRTSRKDNTSGSKNRKKSEVERLLNRSHSEPRQKKNERDLRSNANDSKTRTVNKKSEADVLADRDESQPNQKINESASRQTRRKNEVESLLDEEKSRSSRKESELNSRSNRRAKSDSRSVQSKNETETRNKNENTRQKGNKSDLKQKENKVDVKNKENKLDLGHKGNKSDEKQKENTADTRQKDTCDTRQKETSTRHKNKSDALKSRNADESDSQTNRENESNSRLTRKSLSSPTKKVGQREGTTKEANGSKSLEEAKKQPLLPQAANNTSLGRFREYSSLEDHAIVAWISRGPRARQVNGNRVWRELQQEYSALVGLARTWHSLRNRYLRYILPRLGNLSISPPRAADLRAAAAKGEIKSHRRPPQTRSPPRVLSAWAARPRTRPASTSDSTDSDNRQHIADGEKKRLLETRVASAWSARAPRDGSSSESEEPRAKRNKPTHASRASGSPRVPTPSYRELTRRFAPKLRSTPNTSPPPPPRSPPIHPHRSRRLYNPKTAL